MERSLYISKFRNKNKVVQSLCDFFKVKNNATSFGIRIRLRMVRRKEFESLAFGSVGCSNYLFLLIFNRTN